MATTTKRGAAAWISMLLVAVVLASGTIAWQSELLAGGKKDKRVVKLKKRKKYGGLKPAELAARWWQWAFSAPRDVNPLLDETGDSVEVGQSGDIWFLCGVFNDSGTATRNATIPQGVHLFFPILNTIIFDDGNEPRVTEESAIEEAAAAFEVVDVDELFLEIDGVPVKDLHKGAIASETFSLWLPEDNVLDHWNPYDRSVFWPAATAGYWVMLAPLPIGEHTIRFGGMMENFGLDITYHLTVVDRTVP